MARSKKTPLSRDEWDFTGPQICKPPLSQWNDWLNYEYARSCRPIVQAVLDLRSRKINEREWGSLPPPVNFPRHAVYLADNYPGFPLKPWLTLPASQRNIRNEPSDQAGGPFEVDTLQEIDTFDFCDRIATGDIQLDRQNIPDQQYSMFKIDFLRDGKLIEKKFRHWLNRRKREYFKIRAAAEDKIRSQAAMPPNFPKAVHSGQSRNKRNYTTSFNQLAALRLLEHFKYDYLECGRITTTDVDEKPLYNDKNNTRWFDAADKAIARLVSFNCMWTLAFEPAYFFKFHEFHEVLFWHPTLRADISQSTNKSLKADLLKRFFCSIEDVRQMCCLNPNNKLA
jgi:hypothetical protein